MDDPNMHAYGEDGPDDAEIGHQWREDSSLGKWFPLTADRLAELEAEVRRLRGIVPEVLERLNDELCAENERLRSELADARQCAKHEADLAQQALDELARLRAEAGRAEPGRPDILERLTYHALERDDMTLDDCLSYLAAGWTTVRGRTEREMVLQLLSLLAAQPAPADPMDWPLPCDVKVGHGTHGKGTKLRELVARMQLLYDMAQEAQLAPAVAQPDVDAMRAALEFYAAGEHFARADETAWDTVSGEPQNWWCDDAGTATIEDGTIAKRVLAGELTAEDVRRLDDDDEEGGAA